MSEITIKNEGTKTIIEIENKTTDIIAKDLLHKITGLWADLRDMGGCDAKKGTYDDGWDSAIKAVDELFMETFGNDLTAEPYEGKEEEEE